MSLNDVCTHEVLETDFFIFNITLRPSLGCLYKCINKTAGGPHGNPRQPLPIPPFSIEVIKNSNQNDNHIQAIGTGK